MTGQVGRIWALTPAPGQELAGLAQRLAAEGAFGERVWWFGWGEGTLQLPAAFPHEAFTQSQSLRGWEVVHVFGERAELHAWRRGEEWRMAWMAEGPADGEPSLPGPLADRRSENPVLYPYVRRARRLAIGQRMELVGPGGERRRAWGEVRFREMSGLRRADGSDREVGDSDERLIMGVYLYLDSRYRMQAVRRAKLEWVPVHQLWIERKGASAARGGSVDAVR